MSTGRDPNVDSCEFMGALLEEFMDVPPAPDQNPYDAALPDQRLLTYQEQRERIEQALKAEGLQYFRGGRIIPTGTSLDPVQSIRTGTPSAIRPTSIDELLLQVLKGLRRAMYPLTHRRKGLPMLTFGNEYDVQDLLHVLLRPWVRDIRPEEYTPSYAGKSTRMDFLLADHATVIELKFVRDATHGRSIGQELLIDIGHYRQHPKCQRLWCVVFDPDDYLVNSGGLVADVEGQHRQDDRCIDVKVLVI